MINYVTKGKLQVARELYEFINSEALPGSGLDTEMFWAGFEEIIHGLTPENKELLATRA